MSTGFTCLIGTYVVEDGFQDGKKHRVVPRVDQELLNIREDFVSVVVEVGFGASQRTNFVLNK